MPDALKSCIFCDYIINENTIIENQLAIAVYDNYPVNKGHIHLIPRYFGDVENPRGGVRNLKKPLVEYDG